jgi:hypothetical protein
MESQEVFDAIEFATQVHRGKFLEATSVPYIVHPVSVAKVLIDYGCEECHIVAGILHRVVDDPLVNVDDFAARFGERVARIVDSFRRDDSSACWEDRMWNDLKSIREEELDVLIVRSADEIVNIKGIQEDLLRLGDGLWSDFDHNQDDLAWYYRGVAAELLGRMDDEPTSGLFRRFADEVNAVFPMVLLSDFMHGRDERELGTIYTLALTYRLLARKSGDTQEIELLQRVEGSQGDDWQSNGLYSPFTELNNLAYTWDHRWSVGVGFNRGDDFLTLDDEILHAGSDEGPARFS